MAEARALKLCTKGDYIKSGQRDDKSPLKGAWFAHVTHFFLRNCGLRKNLVTARSYRWHQQDGPLFVSPLTVAAAVTH